VTNLTCRACRPFIWNKGKSHPLIGGIQDPGDVRIILQRDESVIRFNLIGPCSHVGAVKSHPTAGQIARRADCFKAGCFHTDCATAFFPQAGNCLLPDPPPHTSTLALSELSWMNSRRGSTTSPISLVKMSSASSTSLILTCSSERSLVSSVVSQSWLGFISPRPL
jgi:hypothetical protein